MLDTIIETTINKFDLPNYLLKKIKSIKYILTKYQAYTQKKNKKQKKNRRKAIFRMISQKKILTQPKFAKKTI